jgi:hypothetical protein
LFATAKVFLGVAAILKQQRGAFQAASKIRPILQTRLKTA